ncbi:hypothetical protein T4B_3248, partial [Trichinella pseudospiralis]
MALNTGRIENEVKKIKMQMAPYKNLYKTRSRSNEYKRHVGKNSSVKKEFISHCVAFARVAVHCASIFNVPNFMALRENADDTKQIADDTKQIEDDTKQNCGMKTYGICGSPRVPI